MTRLMNAISAMFATRGRRRAAQAGGIGAAVAVIIALALPGIEEFEGVRTQAYYDPVGIPTVCLGETRNVSIGDSYSIEECFEMLTPRMEGFLAEMRACTTVELPAKTEAAFLLFTYNLGAGVYCRNMAAQRINQGNLEEACDAMLLYNRAGGRVWRGLERRRAHERGMCLEGLREAGLI